MERLGRRTAGESGGRSDWGFFEDDFTENETRDGRCCRIWSGRHCYTASEKKRGVGLIRDCSTGNEMGHIPKQPKWLSRS